MQKKKKQTGFWKGFDFAWQGIVWNIWNERNMRIHLIILLVMTLMGVVFKIGLYEWLILLVFFALIPALELVNSAIESTCDILRDELKLDYKATKWPRDLAAGAVFWAAIGSILAGLMIFLPRIVYVIFSLLKLWRVF